MQVSLIMLELLSLRYIAGSWLMAGASCWTLLVPWEIASGQLNLIAAAAISAAVRGCPSAAAVMGLAKVGPVLAVHPRDRRRFLGAIAIFTILSLPNLMAWVWWVQRLLVTLRNAGRPARTNPVSAAVTSGSRPGRVGSMMAAVHWVQRSRRPASIGVHSSSSWLPLRNSCRAKPGIPRKERGGPTERRRDGGRRSSPRIGSGRPMWSPTVPVPDVGRVAPMLDLLRTGAGPTPRPMAWGGS